MARLVLLLDVGGAFRSDASEESGVVLETGAPHCLSGPGPIVREPGAHILDPGAGRACTLRARCTLLGGWVRHWRACVVHAVSTRATGLAQLEHPSVAPLVRPFRLPRALHAATVYLRNRRGAERDVASHHC